MSEARITVSLHVLAELLFPNGEARIEQCLGPSAKTPMAAEFVISSVDLPPQDTAEEEWPEVQVLVHKHRPVTVTFEKTKK